ncbi:HPr family phosphocarrier protein [Rummeliibacillus pycnus]|uniref:HPr family phosphocarrier protein n=1 Tax=Rummeliibacillus pycnus TaxID=101070 RepID=UPI0037C513C1
MEKQFIITAAEGLHARPCTLLVQAVTPFSTEVQLSYKGRSVNMKSIMGVMSLGIPSGSTITISSEGTNADKLLAKVASVITTEGIGEEC